MTTEGQWFKVEAYGFIPLGGEMRHDAQTLKAVVDGLAALGFAAVQDLSVALVKPGAATAD